MATDPRRTALIKALLERDLYGMLEVDPGADTEEVAAAIARRRDAVPQLPAAERMVERHWLDWAERALVLDADLRSDYDAARAQAIEEEVRRRTERVERRRLEQEVRRRRDEIARREEEKTAVQVVRPPAAPGRSASGASAGAAPRRRSRTRQEPPAAAQVAAARAVAEAVTDADEALREMTAAIGRDDAAAALAYADRAVALRSDVPTLVAAAGAQQRMGDLDAAVTSLREVIRQEPEPSEAAAHWSALAAVLRQAGRPAEARDVARRVVEAVPDSGNAWAVLGAALVDLGDTEQAESALAQAAAIGPQRSGPIAKLRSIRKRYLDKGDERGAERVAQHLRRLGLS